MPRLTVRTELVIHADAQRIWRLILDFESYPQWNPSIRRARGAVAPGTAIELWTAMLPFGPQIHVDATVLEVEPPRRLRWIGALHPDWLFTGEHRFVLHPTEEGAVLLVQEETFRGLLVLFLAPYLRWRIRRLFEGTSAALKRMAEPQGVVVGDLPVRQAGQYAGGGR